MTDRLTASASQFGGTILPSSQANPNSWIVAMSAMFPENKNWLILTFIEVNFFWFWLPMYPHNLFECLLLLCTYTYNWSESKQIQMTSPHSVGSNVRKFLPDMLPTPTEPRPFDRSLLLLSSSAPGLQIADNFLRATFLVERLLGLGELVLMLLPTGHETVHSFMS